MHLRMIGTIAVCTAALADDDATAKRIEDATCEVCRERAEAWMGQALAVLDSRPLDALVKRKGDR